MQPPKAIFKWRQSNQGVANKEDTVLTLSETILQRNCKERCCSINTESDSTNAGIYNKPIANTSEFFKAKFNFESREKQQKLQDKRDETVFSATNTDIEIICCSSCHQRSDAGICNKHLHCHSLVLANASEFLKAKFNFGTRANQSEQQKLQENLDEAVFSATITDIK